MPDRSQRSDYRNIVMCVLLDRWLVGHNGERPIITQEDVDGLQAKYGKLGAVVSFHDLEDNGSFAVDLRAPNILDVIQHVVDQALSDE